MYPPGELQADLAVAVGEANTGVPDTT